MVSSEKKKSWVLLAVAVHRALVLPQFFQIVSPILTVSFGGNYESRRLVCSSDELTEYLNFSSNSVFLGKGIPAGPATVRVQVYSV